MSKALKAAEPSSWVPVSATGASPSAQHLLEEEVGKDEAGDAVGITVFDAMTRRSFDSNGNSTHFQDGPAVRRVSLGEKTGFNGMRTIQVAENQADEESDDDVTIYDIMQRRSFDGARLPVSGAPRRRRSLDESVDDMHSFKLTEVAEEDGKAEDADVKAVIGPLDWSGRFGGGLVEDIKRRAPYYASDWVDGFVPAAHLSKTMSSIMFLFFACMSPAVAFGTLFSDFTENQLGVIEMILSSGICGIVYALFSGQPLSILGATGPELAYTLVFWNMCKTYDIEFLPARVWQGLWTALFTILLSLTDSCALMRHVTRFTEEIFSAVISSIFIIEAFLAVGNLYANSSGSYEGAFLGTVLCFASYGLATWFKDRRHSTLFTPAVRNFLANYGVTISIVIFSGVTAAFSSVGTEMLDVPRTFRPTWNNPETGVARNWIVNPMGINKAFPVWAMFATAFPALGLTFLGYMDQNLTSLLINRKDHKLKKPPAYHLDLFTCGVFVYPVCGFLGLPFTHAATVRSMTHMVSLTTYGHKELECGGTHQVVADVVEQRVSNFTIHVWILLSLTIAPVLQMVPKAVLFGVFLFMGVGSMAGNQLFDRMYLLLIWDPSKFPKYAYVKQVDTWRMHKFTLFQTSMLVILYVLTRVDAVAVVFPFFIGLLVFVRKALGLYFTEAELAVLDS